VESKEIEGYGGQELARKTLLVCELPTTRRLFCIETLGMPTTVMGSFDTAGGTVRWGAGGIFCVGR
jgi:hypothetical protein